jgi:hypothetical protein
MLLFIPGEFNPITLPQFTILTDRAEPCAPGCGGQDNPCVPGCESSAKLWVLTHSLEPHLMPDPDDPEGPPIDDMLGYISISDQMPRRKLQGQRIIYGPLDGPIIARGVRLLVRGGYLGIETDERVQGLTDISQARIFSRRDMFHESRVLVLPVGYKDGDVIAWRPLCITGPNCLEENK